MIGDGFVCGFLANSSSRYDAPDGRIQAVTIDISNMF